MMTTLMMLTAEHGEKNGKKGERLAPPTTTSPSLPPSLSQTQRRESLQEPDCLHPKRAIARRDAVVWCNSSTPLSRMHTFFHNCTSIGFSCHEMRMLTTHLNPRQRCARHEI